MTMTRMLYRGFGVVMRVDADAGPVDALPVDFGHQLLVLLLQALVTRILTGVQITVDGGSAASTAAADDRPEIGGGREGG